MMPFPERLASAHQTASHVNWDQVVARVEAEHRASERPACGGGFYCDGPFIAACGKVTCVHCGRRA